MTIAEMFEQSGVLALLGMGVVFSFLLLLVLSITITGKIIHALGLDKDVSASPVDAAKTEQNTHVVAAITAAVHEYRKS